MKLSTFPLKLFNVVRSPLFQYCEVRSDNNENHLHVVDRPGPILTNMKFTEEITSTDGRKFTVGEWREVDRSRHDPARANWDFIITEVHPQYGQNSWYDNPSNIDLVFKHDDLYLHMYIDYYREKHLHLIQIVGQADLVIRYYEKNTADC